MVDRHTLRALTPERLVEITSRWTGIAGQEEFEVELSAFFEWCTSHLERGSADGYALELYNVTKDKTDAILDVNQGKWGTMTKLLKMYVSPEFWPADVHSPALIATHAGAYTAFIYQGLADGVREVKIYGRSDVMLSMLTTLQEMWQAFDTGSAATMQGRWLSITTSS